MFFCTPDLGTSVLSTAPVGLDRSRTIYPSHARATHPNFLADAQTTRHARVGDHDRPREPPLTPLPAPLRPWGTPRPIPHIQIRNRAAGGRPTHARQHAHSAEHDMRARAALEIGPRERSVGGEQRRGRPVVAPHTAATAAALADGRRSHAVPQTHRSCAREASAEGQRECEKAVRRGIRGRWAAAYLRRACRSGVLTAQGAGLMDRTPGGRATQKKSHPASPQDGLAERLRRRHTGESVNSGIMVRVWRYAVAHCRAFGDMIESKLLTTALAEPRQIAHSTCGTHTLARAAIRRGKFGDPLRLIEACSRWCTLAHPGETICITWAQETRLRAN